MIEQVEPAGALTMDSPIATNALRVPTGLAALVQRRAVLEPLAGPVEGNEAVIIATRQVAALWRDRVAALARAGLPELASPRPSNGRAVGRRALAKVAQRRSRALDCPPPFVGSGPRGRTCGLHAICPFCWARQIERLWRAIDTAMFQPEEKRRWKQEMAEYKRPKNLFWFETMARAGVTSFPPPMRPPGPARLARSERFSLIEWWARSFDVAAPRRYPTRGWPTSRFTG